MLYICEVLEDFLWLIANSSHPLQTCRSCVHCSISAMSAFGREDDDAGGDDHTLLVEEHVDESQLKLPTHKFDVAKAAPVKSLEEEEDVIFQE